MCPAPPEAKIPHIPMANLTSSPGKTRKTPRKPHENSIKTPIEFPIESQ
jgi:hypothetical protein